MFKLIGNLYAFQSGALERGMVAGGWAKAAPTRMGMSNVNSAIGAS